jgi:hypothetical protein
MHAFDYTAVDFLIALHDFGVSTDRSLERAKAAAMLLSSGWGWKEAPSGPVKPCHAECSWGCTAGLGDESKAVGCVSPTALLSERARSIQDQQNQIRDQHDCSRPSYREH